MKTKICNPFEDITYQISILERLMIDVRKDLRAFKNQTNFNDRFLTKKEVAEIWKCHVRTVDNLAEDGVIQRHMLGSSVRFKLSEVMQALEIKKA